MKVGDLVRGAYDKGKYRTGVIIRMVEMHNEEWGSCAHVLWNSAPVGLSQTGAQWARDLEVISESR